LRLRCGVDEPDADLVHSDRDLADFMITVAGLFSEEIASYPRNEGGRRCLGKPLLEARGLSCSFGSVRALNHADSDGHAGEVVALVGDNGAWKAASSNRLQAIPISTKARCPLKASQHPPHASSASAMGIEGVYRPHACAAFKPSGKHADPPSDDRSSDE
jgi:hypothetical protein